MHTEEELYQRHIYVAREVEESGEQRLPSEPQKRGQQKSNPRRVGNEEHCSLTVKLRGRTEAPDWSRGCTLSSRTRSDTTDSHGPLQRLLERAPEDPSVPIHL